MRFFKTPLPFVLFAASAFGQTILINSPTDGTTVHAGFNYTVELGFPIYVENVDWVSVVVGLLSWPTSGYPAAGPSAFLGIVIGQAAYDPVTGRTGGVSQNIAVTIPDATPPGEASIGVAAFAVAGASGVPGLHYANVTVYVA